MSTNCCELAALQKYTGSWAAGNFVNSMPYVPSVDNHTAKLAGMYTDTLFNYAASSNTGNWAGCGGWGGFGGFGCGCGSVWMGPQTFTAKDSVGAIQTWNNDLSWGDMFNGVAKQGVANAFSQLLTKDNIVGAAQGLLGVLSGGADSISSALG